MAALHLAALAVQRMVRGHQARLLVAFATSNEPALRHRAPKACRSAAKAAADRLKQKKPAAAAAPAAAAKAESSAADAQLDDSEIGLISRFLEVRMRRGDDAAELTFNDFCLLRLQAWGRMMPWRDYLRIMLKRPLLRLAALGIQQCWRAFRIRAPRRAETTFPAQLRVMNRP